LFVKCFSLLVFIITLIGNSFADTYLVMPEDAVEKEISLGDIINVTIVNQDSSERTPKGKRIGPVFYILEGVGERKYRVVVSPKKKIAKKNNNEVKKEQEDEFVYRGFKFSKDLSSYASEFVVKDVKYETKTKKNNQMIIIFIALFLFPALIKLAISLIRKAKTKKRLLIKRNKLVNKIKMAKTRSDIEELYKFKNEIKEILNADEKKINEFVTQLNLVQFKKNWEEDDLKVVNNAISILRQVV